MLVEQCLFKSTSKSFLLITRKHNLWIFFHVGSVNAVCDSELICDTRWVCQQCIHEQIHVLSHVAIEHDCVSHHLLFKVGQCSVVKGSSFCQVGRLYWRYAIIETIDKNGYSIKVINRRCALSKLIIPSTRKVHDFVTGKRLVFANILFNVISHTSLSFSLNKA